jgi:hypothetical protein
VTTITRRVGRYELLRVIGRGGMATVYLARQTDLDRHVALKELTLFDGSEPQLSRRFLREARLAGSLSHPNIVTVHDYVEQDGVPYIAMEYLARGSLRPYLGRLSLPQVGGVLQGLLAGLAYAEELGVVHRDIKPENVMVTSQGSVKIADFGIAKATRAAATRTSLTTTGTTLGTPRYMAPERAMGQDVGPWSDLYSVGVMVFELLVGRPPFHDTEAPMAILMRQINDPIPSVSSVRPDVDPAVSDWVDRLLVKNPEDRTPSAATAWSELEGILHVLGARWLRDAPLPASPADPPPATGTRTSRGPATRTTARLDDRRLAATVAPATHRLGYDPPRRTRPSGRRMPGAAQLALVAGTVVVAIAAAGALGGGGSSGGIPDPARRTAAVTAGNGEVGLTAPAGWRETSPGSGVPLPLENPIAVEGGGGADGGSVIAGMVPGETAANVSLLAPAFLQSLGLPPGQIPPRSRVVLGAGRVEAWRYEQLHPNGSDPPLTVYAVPTTAGVATLACVPPRAGEDAFAGRCESIANTLRIGGARAYPLGPSEQYAEVLDSALGALERRAQRLTADFGAASTPTAKARLLRSLARDYWRAARSLLPLDLSPADHTANGRLVAALRKLSRAYASAGSGDVAAGAAQTRIDDGLSAMDGALASLRAAGYATGADGRIRVLGGDAGTGSAGGDPPGNAPSSNGSTGAAGGDAPAGAPSGESGVGDSRSDDPSDDEPDEDDDGD